MPYAFLYVKCYLSSFISGIANVTEKFIFLFPLNQLLLLFEDDSQREDILNILKCIHICCTTVSDDKLRQKHLKDAVCVIQFS